MSTLWKCCKVMMVLLSFILKEMIRFQVDVFTTVIIFHHRRNGKKDVW